MSPNVDEPKVRSVDLIFDVAVVCAPLILLLQHVDQLPYKGMVRSYVEIAVERIPQNTLHVEVLPEPIMSSFTSMLFHPLTKVTLVVNSFSPVNVSHIATSTVSPTSVPLA